MRKTKRISNGPFDKSSMVPIKEKEKKKKKNRKKEAQEEIRVRFSTAIRDRVL